MWVWGKYSRILVFASLESCLKSIQNQSYVIRYFRASTLWKQEINKIAISWVKCKENIKNVAISSYTFFTELIFVLNARNKQNTMLFLAFNLFVDQIIFLGNFLSS